MAASKSGMDSGALFSLANFTLSDGYALETMLSYAARCFAARAVRKPLECVRALRARP